MIRTTVKMPVWLHKKLRLKATKTEKTFSEVVLEAFLNQNSLKELDEIEKQVEKDLAFFDKIAKSGPQFDGAEVIRKQRDMRTKKYV